MNASRIDNYQYGIELLIDVQITSESSASKARTYDAPRSGASVEGVPYMGFSQEMAEAAKLVTAGATTLTRAFSNPRIYVR